MPENRREISPPDSIPEKRRTVRYFCLGCVLLGTLFFSLLPGLIGQKKLPVDADFVEYSYIESLPAEEIVQIRDVRERKEYLIHRLLPLILRANEEILSQRSTLQKLKRRGPWLTEKQKRFLDDLAQRYLVDANSYDELIEILLTRVDVLPVSLVLAQAAIESGWGTSRFSLEGNNLFGLRTPHGSGMVPEHLDDGALHRVSVFDDLQSCIRYHIWNINTHPMYEVLRQIRSQSEPPYDSLRLAQGLENFSEMGYAYVEKVKELIDYNNLKCYDSYKLQ
ncbi:MAG: glucosaminidase domain-containing protein [Desulfomonilia bacterium]